MKKHIALVLLILLVITSILYLIPNFKIDFQGKTYTFQNFPSSIDKAYENLKVNIPGLNDTYITVIESETSAANDNEWSGLASRDQKTLEQRLETVLGNDFELRMDKADQKVRFTLTSTEKIYDSSLLTAKNDIFEIASVSAAAATDQTEQPTQQKTPIDLKREDFGYAEVVKEQSQQGQLQYAVRMPLSLILGPDKIQLINNNLFSQITVNVAGQEYTGNFDYNTTGVATHLKLSGLSTINQANTVKAFLNTPALALSYQIKERDYAFLSVNKVYTSLGLVLVLVALAALINRFTVKNLSWKKALLILAIVIIYFAALKLFAIEITLTTILLILTTVILTLFNSRSEYYLALFSVLLITKIIGFLPSFDISIPSLLITTLFASIIWLTNYVQIKDKKYE